MDLPVPGNSGSGSSPSTWGGTGLSSPGGGANLANLWGQGGEVVENWVLKQVNPACDSEDAQAARDGRLEMAL